MVLGDNFTVKQRKQYVVVSMSIGIALSTVSLAARLWARKLVIGRLRVEDWLMIAGTIISYGTAICMFYGVLATDLTVPFNFLPPEKRSASLLMIWTIQKLQPPTLFFIKASIITFHCHIFQSRQFRALSWVLGILTFLWMVASILGTTLQCSPPSFFYNKQQPGSCVRRAIHSIGVTNGVLSSVGDMVILVMPIFPLSKLRIDRKTKFGLIGVFSLGIFAIGASILRWVALINADSDTSMSSSQVQVGVWTYLEISVGITCGNLPFLAPLLGCVGPRKPISFYPFKLSRKSRGPRRQSEGGVLEEMPEGSYSSSLGGQAKQTEKVAVEPEEERRRLTWWPSPVMRGRLSVIPEVETVPAGVPGRFGEGVERDGGIQRGYVGGMTRLYDSSPEGSSFDVGVAR